MTKPKRELLKFRPGDCGLKIRKDGALEVAGVSEDSPMIDDKGMVMAFKEKEFIRSSLALGASPMYVIFVHLIPNSISPIIVGFVQAIPLAMMLEAGLSFLGVGIQPPLPSWGQMINIGISFMFFYWHMALFPTLALAITVLVTTLFGDGLRDALDPTLKGKN